MRDLKSFSAILLLIPLLTICSLSTRSWANPTPRSNEAIQYWASELQPSANSKKAAIAELEWFREASMEFDGRQILSVAEDIKTHYWEQEVLTKAFYDITGIRVKHDVIGEGSVVQSLMKQITTGQNSYDIYVSDADLIGTHMRMDAVVNLSKYSKSKGKKYTNPDLALDDFLNLELGQDVNGEQLQLPDQQFANLYWFRHDWFTRADIKKQFRAFTEEKYGKGNHYELGVPLNWAAYEDIAEFFTKTPVDGNKVYGHLDYGKKSPSLGWRFTDSWLAIAGVGDTGLPNGHPVDEWGIRVNDNYQPVGSSVSRGGATNSPAAIYALEKYIFWLKNYAPPEAVNWRWGDAGPKAAKGNIAQRIFQYITWLSDDTFTQKGSPMLGSDGLPVWRVAPTPHGRYWDSGMKSGYQDAGSWTIPKTTRGAKRNAAWLWAQFCISKTVSLKKFLVGGTPVRRSTLMSEFVQEKKAQWGGLIEFYTSKQEKLWTDTGYNVPHYPLMSQLWWPEISKAIRGEASAQGAMNNIAAKQDKVLSKLRFKKYSPKLNTKRPIEYWLKQEGSPKEQRGRSHPKTMQYAELMKQWED